MKKIIISLLLILTISTPALAVESPNLVTTQNSLVGTSGARQTARATAEQNKVTNLKERAKTEITRRITFLNELSTKITAIKKLSDTDKSTLTTQIQQQIDGLTTLLTKIDSDTDLVTLKADVKSIINGYYIFAFFRVKISLLVAADRLSTTADNMNIVYTKLSTRVAAEKAQGKDVASMEKLLLDMQAKITDAKTQYLAAQTELSTLLAQGYPGNKTSLTDARSKIKLGASDLRTAFQDANKIRQGLGDITGNLKPKNGTDSATKPVEPVE